MRYIAIIHKDKDSAYGVTLPDFPGVFSAADNLDDLSASIQEAVELWAEGQQGLEPPVPASLEAIASLPEAKDATLMLVNIDLSFLDSKAVPVNITMPVYLRNRIDRCAKERGMSRSGLIALAVRDYIR